jgi:hypothetical protein
MVSSVTALRVMLIELVRSSPWAAVVRQRPRRQRSHGRRRADDRRAQAPTGCPAGCREDAHGGGRRPRSCSTCSRPGRPSLTGPATRRVRTPPRRCCFTRCRCSSASRFSTSVPRPGARHLTTAGAG